MYDAPVDPNELIFRVARVTDVKKLAAAIVSGVRDRKRVYLSYVGAAAGQQAVKGAIIARGLLAGMGEDIFLLPSFRDVEEDGRMITGQRLEIIVGRP